MSDLNSKREQAVRGAWKRERELIREGKGTREWSVDEQKAILAKGNLREKYDGHHMKSVKGYPDDAHKPENIQFLTPSEHLQAHGGNTRNVTHGYYDPKTGATKSYKDQEPNVPVRDLEKRVTQEKQNDATKREHIRKAEIRAEHNQERDREKTIERERSR